MKAASKMVTNYDTKLQAKCAAATCEASYPLSGTLGCLNVFTNGASADFIFGFAALPQDNVTGAAIDLVAPFGCNY
jgi:hypothetical protein